MAELDKNMIMGMLESLLSEKGNGASDNQTKEKAVPASLVNETSSYPVPTEGLGDFQNTAEMMSQFTEIMGKFRQAANTKEAVLLSALRPYLRSSRQPKVDTMLRLLQAYQVFSGFKK